LATDRDLETIVSLHAASATVAYAAIFSDPFPVETTGVRWRVFTGAIVISEVADRPVGFVAFDDTELHALYVAPGYWKSGVGSRLLACAENTSYLWVLRDNGPARRFYERHGWHVDGSVRKVDGVDEVRYARRPVTSA
jgi:GNAT superfamily N-acetyltransferase